MARKRHRCEALLHAPTPRGMSACLLRIESVTVDGLPRQPSGKFASRRDEVCRVVRVKRPPLHECPGRESGGARGRGSALAPALLVFSVALYTKLGVAGGAANDEYRRLQADRSTIQRPRTIFKWKRRGMKNVEGAGRANVPRAGVHVSL